MNKIPFYKALAVIALIAAVVGCFLPAVDQSGWVEVDTPGVGAQARERIAILASKDCWWRYGADAYFYSDDLSTQKFHIDGATGNLDAEGTLALAGAFTMGVDGTGADVIFYSDTAGDYLHWDTSAEQLIITGTNTATALDVPDGNVVINDTLDVDGAFDLDGSAFDVDITAGGSIDTDGATNLSASTGDITIDAETGSVNIIGSEADASAIHLDANDTVTSGINIDTGATSGLTIDGGPFSVDGTGAFNVNTASGDITVEAETGSVTVKGDEEAADAIHLDANETITQGIDIDVGSVYGLAIDGGLTDFGSGTYTTADGDNDVGIEGDLEVNGSADIDTDLDVDGTTNLDAVDVDGAIDIAGQTITWDADSDTTSAASSDDVITYTIGGASGYMVIETGNLKVGDGSPSLTLNGEDAYVEGTLEADGAARLDGGATVAGNLVMSNGLILQEADDLAVSDGDTITPTTISAYNLTASGTVTFTLGSSCTDGQMLYLAADSAQTYNVNATNLRTTDGNALAIDQYDVLGFMCFDSEWLLMFEINLQ